jgi:hypothetical protein
MHDVRCSRPLAMVGAAGCNPHRAICPSCPSTAMGSARERGWLLSVCPRCNPSARARSRSPHRPRYGASLSSHARCTVAFDWTLALTQALAHRHTRALCSHGQAFVARSLRSSWCAFIQGKQVLHPSAHLSFAAVRDETCVANYPTSETRCDAIVMPQPRGRAGSRTKNAPGAPVAVC